MPKPAPSGPAPLQIWREWTAGPARALSILGDYMPKGLYARSLLIIITPMVILQAIVTYMFMEKYWQGVTARLSAATTKDIAGIVELYEQLPHTKATRELLQTIAQKQLTLGIEFRPPEDLPPRGARPFFDILDQALSDEMRSRIGLPFWIDTVGRSNLVEIRIKLDDSVLRVFALRSQTFASNSYIYLLWMLGTSPDPDDGGDPVPAQPDPADPAARGRRTGFRQRARRPEFPPARRPRSAAGRRVPSSRCGGASSAPSSSAPPC